MKQDARMLADIFVSACAGLAAKAQRQCARSFAVFLKRRAGARLALAVLDALPAALGRRRGVIGVDIRAVRALRPAEVKAILALLGLGAGDCEVRQRLDSALLGGFTASTQDVRCDASLAARLERIRNSIMK